VRALQIRPDLVTSIRSTDLNIILERLTPGGAPFDLIVATNVLVYYTPFEQALALANIAAMLRPGGLLLTNALKEQLPAPAFSAAIPVDVMFDRRGGGDTLYWFRRH
jgi:chemotaxis methyl-accepting protein methylase